MRSRVLQEGRLVLGLGQSGLAKAWSQLIEEAAKSRPSRSDRRRFLRRRCAGGEAVEELVEAVGIAAAFAVLYLKPEMALLTPSRSSCGLTDTPAATCSEAAIPPRRGPGSRRSRPRRARRSWSDRRRSPEGSRRQCCRSRPERSFQGFVAESVSAPESSCTLILPAPSVVAGDEPTSVAPAIMVWSWSANVFDAVTPKVAASKSEAAKVLVARYGLAVHR